MGAMVNNAEIRRRREALGLTFAESAARAGFKNRQEWYGLESGDRDNPTVKTLYAVAAVLGCKVADILIEVPPAKGKKR